MNNIIISSLIYHVYFQNNKIIKEIMSIENKNKFFFHDDVNQSQLQEYIQKKLNIIIPIF